jgi:hypothetical protein
MYPDFFLLNYTLWHTKLITIQSISKIFDGKIIAFKFLSFIRRIDKVK